MQFFIISNLVHFNELIDFFVFFFRKKIFHLGLKHMNLIFFGSFVVCDGKVVDEVRFNEISNCCVQYHQLTNFDHVA